MINIGDLLDFCGIAYTANKLVNLEKLINDNVQQHIESLTDESKLIIGDLLDFCGIRYKAKKLVKLEKLFNEIVQQHINEITGEGNLINSDYLYMEELKSEELIDKQENDPSLSVNTDNDPLEEIVEGVGDISRKFEKNNVIKEPVNKNLTRLDTVMDLDTNIKDHEETETDASVLQEEKSLPKDILEELKEKQESCTFSSLVSIWDHTPNNNEIKKENMEHKDFLTIEDSDENPWAVEDASVFLKYCCPECDFKHLDLQFFTNHAVKNHCKASTLFTFENCEMNPLHHNEIEEQESSESLKKEDTKNDSINIFQELDCQDSSIDSIEEINDGKSEIILENCDQPPTTDCNEDKGENSNPEELIKLNKAKQNCYMCEASFTSFPKLKDHMVSDHKGKNPLQCTFCNATFTTKQSLQGHVLLIHGGHEQGFKGNNTEKLAREKVLPQCQECGKKFPSPNKLKRHYDGVHLKIKLVKKPVEKRHRKCKYCEKSYFGKMIYEHVKSVHKLFPCRKCDHGSETEELLKKHIMLKHRIYGKKECNVCNEIFVNPFQVYKHMKKFHGRISKWFCRHCDETFTTMNKLRNHVQSVHEKKVLPKCQECDKRFLTPAKLKRHYNNVHLKIKSFCCENCGDSFVDKHRLDQHMINKHSVDTKDFQCDFCGNCYSAQYLLKIHVEKNHKDKIHPEKLFKCDYCDKLFGSKSSLKGHTENVHGNRDKPCPHCDKLFRSKQNVQNHINNAHNKTFLCSQCTYVSTKLLLDSHMKNVHSEEKPFKCEKCNYRFDSKERLEHHFARRHELRNCESCPHCGKQYSKLKVHIQTCNVRWSGVDRPTFKCPNDCGKTFLAKGYLKEHVRDWCHLKQD